MIALLGKGVREECPVSVGRSVAHSLARTVGGTSQRKPFVVVVEQTDFVF